MAPTSVTPRPTRPLRPRVVRWLITAAILIPVLWSALGLEVSWEQVRSAPTDTWNVLREMVPPDFSSEAIERALPKVMESLWIAWIGTLIGATFSFFGAFAAADNVASTSLSQASRQVLNGIRAIPELLLAMVLIPITGLGPWTGALALGIHSIGTLGKLSSEMVEGSDPGPVEAVASVGGTGLQRIRFGLVPQVMPNIVAFWLYRFEINIRASAVLGVVGAGGIGAELVAQIRFRDYARAGTVLFLTIAVVLVIDTISARVRRRIVSGRAEAGPIAALRSMSWSQRVLVTVVAFAVAAMVVFVLYQYQQSLV